MDLSSSLSPDTQGFLQMAEEEGFVRNVGPGDFKSVVICQSGNRTRVYYSPISSKTSSVTQSAMPIAPAAVRRSAPTWAGHPRLLPMSRASARI